MYYIGNGLPFGTRFIGSSSVKTLATLSPLEALVNWQPPMTVCLSYRYQRWYVLRRLLWEALIVGLLRFELSVSYFFSMTFCVFFGSVVFLIKKIIIIALPVEWSNLAYRMLGSKHCNGQRKFLIGLEAGSAGVTSCLGQVFHPLGPRKPQRVVQLCASCDNDQTLLPRRETNWNKQIHLKYTIIVRPDRNSKGA